MPEVKSIDKDLQYYMNTTRIILLSIGTWPLISSSSIIERVVKLMLNCVCSFLFIMILIPGILHIVIRETNLYFMLKNVAPVFYAFISLIQYSIMLYRAQDIRTGMVQMSQDWLNVSSDERKILSIKARVGQKLVQVAATFMYTGCLTYRTIIPWTRGLIADTTNSTTRPLPCPSYFIKFDEQQTPAYEIIYILQMFSGFLVYSVRCGLCGLSTFFVMHVCGQLRILIHRMNTLVEGKDLTNDVIDKRISCIIKLQIKAWTFLKQIEEIIEAMCLVEIVGSTVLLCLLGYYIIMVRTMYREWERNEPASMLTYLIILISFVVSIFTFCYIGQHLDNESTNVGLASRTIDWYRLPAKKARCLVLIIAMSNIPMKVTAGKMMDMSLSSFTDVMKTAITYLNMLRTVM